MSYLIFSLACLFSFVCGFVSGAAKAAKSMLDAAEEMIWKRDT